MAGIDFGYPWWLSYGHFVIVIPSLLLLWLALRRKWPGFAVVVLSVVAVWSLASFAVARFTLNVNGRLALPTQEFLTSGAGRVLDMGAGTGRSTLMVLESRPRTSVVALDLFADSYEHHFGKGMSGEERLVSNLTAANVRDRATIQAGDMRKLPFETASFDGIVSTYAIDHLNRDGIDASLGEASRVLKPGGEFLLMVIAKDGWLQFAFGPLLLHSGTRGADWWESRLKGTGLQVVEQGTRPGTLYFVARKS